MGKQEKKSCSLESETTNLAVVYEKELSLNMQVSSFDVSDPQLACSRHHSLPPNFARIKVESYKVLLHHSPAAVIIGRCVNSARSHSLILQVLRGSLIYGELNFRFSLRPPTPSKSSDLGEAARV